MREAISDDSTQRHFHFGLLLAVVGTALFALKSIFIKLTYLLDSHKFQPVMIGQSDFHW